MKKIANSFKQSIGYAILFGQTSVIGGLWLSYELDWAPGGTIVMISLFVLLVVLASQKQFYRVKSQSD